MSQSILVTITLLVFACPCLAASSAQTQQEQSGGAVHKVLELLNSMVDKATAAKKDDEVQFAGFQQWCKGEKSELHHSIEKELSRISELKATIFKLKVSIRDLGSEIKMLQSDLSKFEADLKATVAQRKKDHAEFVAASRDFMASIDSIERAVASLEKQNFDRPGAAAALLQVSEGMQLPQNAKSMIQAFASLMDADYASDQGPPPQAPKANAYEFQSGGIIDMLKKLGEDFQNKLNERQKEEMNSKHAADMVVVDLEDSIENTKKAIEEKKVQEFKDIRNSALAKKELNEETKEEQTDEENLQVTKDYCYEKKQTHEEKHKVLEEEIEALQKAIYILSDPSTMTGAKHLTLAQTKSKAVTFAQFLHSSVSSTKNEGIEHKLRHFVEKRAAQLRSRNLALLAETLQATEKMSGPFDKVRKMIESMLTRLAEEMKSDAKNEAWCDKEIGKSKITRTELTEDVDSLQAAIDESKAEIITLEEDLAKLAAEVAALDKAMKDATELRHKESAENAAIVKEETEAEHAVIAAENVLKEFYKNTALVQLKNGERDPRQMDEAGGVIALLETILADFANIKADALAHESEATKSYASFMSEAKLNKATKLKAEEMDQADMVEYQSKMRRDENDLKGTQNKLVAAERYYKSLEPRCIGKAESYEDRKAAREAEMQSLKEAIGMFENM